MSSTLKYVDINVNELYNRVLELTKSCNCFFKKNKGVITVDEYREFNLNMGKCAGQIAHALVLNTQILNYKKFYYKKAIYKYKQAVQTIEKFDVDEEIKQQIQDIKIILFKISKKYKLYGGN